MPRRDKIKRLSSDEYLKWFEEERQRLELRDRDSLFGSGDPPRLSVPVGAANLGLHIYSRGFSDAADAIVECITQGHLSMDDGYLFPLIALYRHSIELELKSLIIETRSLLDKEPEVPTGHKILPLWEKARPLLEEALAEPSDRKNLDHIEEYLRILHRMPYAFARYPFDEKGERVVPPEEFKEINLKPLKDAMNRLYSALRSLSE